MFLMTQPTFDEILVYRSNFNIYGVSKTQI
jgi:hypothetical protein